ncbi:MAG: hypothetical protein EBY21_04215, partial [Alphaproteobacteria bacterium]|nr:hypothetical protein [Alphaproteobacteria bacterium]
ANKNTLANAGVRVQNFSVETQTTIPEYDFQIDVNAVDRDQSPLGISTGDAVKTSFTIHVDPLWLG